jgi:hypothetical protein
MSGLVPFVWMAAGLGVTSCLGLAVMLVQLHLNFRSAPELKPPPPADAELEETLAVSQLLVVVPAYNEADNIGECLQALLASEPACASWSVLVVDDDSTDATVALARAAAAEDPHFRLLEAGPRPSGETWVGKNWPCWRGSLATASEGEPGPNDWLLFLDADVRVTPEALRWALADAIRNGAELLTLAPRLRCGCLAEWLVQPIIVSLLGLSFPIQRANDPSDPLAFASGPFMLFQHSSYRALGGHRAVAAEVVEDLALGRAIKQAGLRLRYLLAIDSLTLRMYRDFAALWEGWTKNWFFHRAVAVAAGGGMAGSAGGIRGAARPGPGRLGPHGRQPAACDQALESLALPGTPGLLVAGLGRRPGDRGDRAGFRGEDAHGLGLDLPRTEAHPRWICGGFTPHRRSAAARW